MCDSSHNRSLFFPGNDGAHRRRKIGTMNDPDKRSKQDAWIEQVLGFKFPAGSRSNSHGPGRRWPMACEAWRAATAAVDAQLGVLQKALRASDDPEVIEIAEFGLNAVTGNYTTQLTELLVDLGDASPVAVQRSGAKTLALLGEFRSHIETDPRVAACDGNPSAVPVSIRATIGPALAGLEAALKLPIPA
jgi:hypothetical protein